MGIISFNTTGKDSLGWRLGNQMFQYASLLGIARKNNLTPYFNIENTYLNKCFKLGGVENKVLSEHHHKLFDGSSSFNSMFFQLPNEYNFDINGYLQTPKYFEHCGSEIKKEFEFQDSIKENAVKALPKDKLVSIHVRRTDYLNKPDYHTNLQIDYYRNALEHFDGHAPIVFSDDIDWCKENLSDLAKTVYFSENPPADGNNGVYIDLCMMTLCDAHIIANSSFSWWGSYLGGGKTVAPKRWNGPDGPQDFQDIYLSDWIICD